MENKISLIATIIDLITVIVTLIMSISMPQLANFCIIILIFLSIGLLVSLIISFKKNQQLSKKIGLSNRQIAQCEKDLYYSMKNSYKRDEDISTINKLVMNGLKDYVNIIADILSEYTKKQVTVSIRFFKEIKEPIDNSILSVLSYSKNCDIDREALFNNEITSSKIVNQNTDFMQIVGENIKYKVDYIYEPDLSKYDDKLNSQGIVKGYENTTPNRKKYYNGRIVIPICADNNSLFFKKETNGIDIKGFLCADVKEKNAFPNSENKKYFLIYLFIGILYTQIAYNIK